VRRRMLEKAIASPKGTAIVDRDHVADHMLQAPVIPV